MKPYDPTTTTERRPRFAGTWMAALAAALTMLIAPEARALVVDRIVATVNGEVITLYDLYSAETPIFGKIILPDEFNVKTPQDRAMERDLLNSLVEERLLLQKARDRGITVPPEETDDAIRYITKDKGMTDEMLAQGLSLRGITMATYRERITKQITISKIIGAEVQSKIVVTPEEVYDYYRKHLPEYSTQAQVKIRHILILKENSGAAEARALADKAASLLAAGTDFRRVAEEYSRDSSRQKGDVSGFIQPGDTLPEIEKVIFTLSPGQVSPVIESPAGFHILKVEEKKEAAVKTLGELTPQITSKLSDEKSTKGIRDYIEKTRSESAIDIRL